VAGRRQRAIRLPATLAGQPLPLVECGHQGRAPAIVAPLAPLSFGTTLHKSFEHASEPF
jgi:hypothetical protein